MDVFEACKTGNIEWLKQQTASGKLPQLMQKNSNADYSHRLAAANGHLDVLKWLVKLSAEAHVEESGQPVDVTAGNNIAVRVAARNGHLDVVKWLVKDYADWLVVKTLEDPNFTGQPVNVAVCDNDPIRWAAANGHLDVVKWLVQESGQSVDVTACDNQAVRWAEHRSHEAVVDYLNVVTPLIQAVGLTVCRSVGFEAVSEMLTAQAVSKSTTRRL